MTIPVLPDAERERLHKNEVANRSRVRKKGLRAIPCSVEGLWLLQRGMCPCPKCDYKKPLIIGKIVIAHRDFTSGKGSAGHVPKNVELWNDDCNKEEAPKETHAYWKGKRFTPDCVPIVEKREKKDKSKTNWPKGRTLPTKADRERVRNR